MSRGPILVTGATGYIGGELLPRLLSEGYDVRVLVRDQARIEGRWWRDRVDVVEGDVLKPETLPTALEGIDVAYYNIHSLYAGSGFHELDAVAAGNFAQAATEAGVGRVIYLGGLGNPQDKLSPHLHSRQETGAVLREGRVPVTEFRAAIIIGSGSGSFEMIRYLTERIPLLVSPRWVFSKIQPIAIGDVVDYLVGALEVSESIGQIVEIGGPDVMSYADTMMEYARVRGLRRAVLPVPALTPTLSSHWVGWVTPISARLARPLIEGVHNEVVVRDGKAGEMFPEIRPMNYRAAVELALADLGPGSVDTSWMDGQVALNDRGEGLQVERREGLYIRRQYRTVEATPQCVYGVAAGLGGDCGWLRFNWAWRLRGWVDRLVGGVGFRCGRRDPHDLQVGDAVDFMRVEAVEPGQMLRLRFEGKMPGRFWLQFEVQPLSDSRSRLVQTLYVETKGLLGLLYWYVAYPAHAIIFSALLRAVSAEAEECAAALGDGPLLSAGGTRVP
jgi:uncharacterized protein YbjT (DUF2867 family)